jgi:hypothetical protein
MLGYRLSRPASGALLGALRSNGEWPEKSDSQPYKHRSGRILETSLKPLPMHTHAWATTAAALQALPYKQRRHRGVVRQSGAVRTVERAALLVRATYTFSAMIRFTLRRSILSSSAVDRWLRPASCHARTVSSRVGASMAADSAACSGSWC